MMKGCYALKIILTSILSKNSQLQFCLINLLSHRKNTVVEILSSTDKYLFSSNKNSPPTFYPVLFKVQGFSSRGKCFYSSLCTQKGLYLTLAVIVFFPTLKFSHHFISLFNPLTLSFISSYPTSFLLKVPAFVSKCP